jgi:GT2 family glycosyltransferase
MIGTTEIAVAIVSYNTREHLRNCLATVLTETASETVVVDNASSDGSVEMIRSEYPWVVLCANRTNDGYGGAANQAIARCDAPYILLLNSDTRLCAGALQALSAYLDQQPQVAVVGPRLVNPDGTLQASCYPFPTPLHIFAEESALGRLIRYIPGLRRHYLRTWPHTHARTVPWVLGAALAIRREAFEAVGGFDKSFFMYFEEVDLCYRLRAAGWQVHFAPVAMIEHIGGASTRQRSSAMARQLFASAAHFYQRHYSRGRLKQLQLVVAILMLAKITRDAVRLSQVRDIARHWKLVEEMLTWYRILDDAGHAWVSYGKPGYNDNRYHISHRPTRKSAPG